jgi:hypothetical protein
MKEEIKEEWKEIKLKNGESVKDIVTMISYRDGFVVATKNGLYTNVKELFDKNGN